MLTVELKCEGEGREVIEVRNLRAAVLTCNERIRQRGVGASNWQGGLVRLDGKRAYMISYNGRVWKYEPRGWTTATPEITGAELDKEL